MIILSLGGFMVFITNHQTQERKLLVKLAVTGFFLGFVVALIRTGASN